VSGSIRGAVPREDRLGMSRGSNGLSVRCGAQRWFAEHRAQLWGFREPVGI